MSQTRLQILVKPRSSANRVSQSADGSIVVHVKAPPVEGEANRMVVDTLAKTLGIPRGNIEIVSGAKSKRKSVLITGLDASEVERRLKGSTGV